MNHDMNVTENCRIDRQVMVMFLEDHDKIENVTSGIGGVIFSGKTHVDPSAPNSLQDFLLPDVSSDLQTQA